MSCGHNLRFPVSQLFLSFFTVTTSSFTELSFPRHHTSHEQQGISCFLLPSTLRSWRSLWSPTSLLFPSNIISFTAYLTIKGLLHRRSAKAISLFFAEEFSEKEIRKPRTWEHVFLKGWLTQLIDINSMWLGLYILLSSSTSLRILSTCLLLGWTVFSLFWHEESHS